MIDEIVKAFGSQLHTVRGAIAGALKKKIGLAVTSEKIEARGAVLSYRCMSATGEAHSTGLPNFLAARHYGRWGRRDGLTDRKLRRAGRSLPPTARRRPDGRSRDNRRRVGLRGMRRSSGARSSIRWLLTVAIAAALLWPAALPHAEDLTLATIRGLYPVVVKIETDFGRKWPRGR